MVGNDAHEQNFFLGSVQLDKKEWEAFLKELSELERKYLLVLGKLDDARNKLQAIGKPSDQTERPLPDPAASKMEQPSGKGGASKDDFFTRLKSKLGSPQPPSTVLGGVGSAQTVRVVQTVQGTHASCSRCGYKISRATRLCERCGADFGRLVCACGRDVPESGRFCDGCGRPVGG